MRLNPVAFNRHLAHMGQKLTWRRSYACACVNPDSGAPDPKHQLCQGKGRLWDAPIDVVAGVTKQDTSTEANPSGIFESGDMIMTVPENSPLWDAGQYDRILMLNSTDVFSQPLKRGGPTERILFTVASFIRVFWLHPTTRLPIDGSLPTVDAIGNLSWPNGGGPPLGVTYSVTGTKYDEYFIFLNLPSDRNEHQGARLPKKVNLRKWDLFGRSNLS